MPDRNASRKPSNLGKSVSTKGFSLLAGVIDASHLDAIMRPTFLFLTLVLSFAAGLQSALLPPGHRPEPVSHHAFTGANLVVSSSKTITNGLLVIKEGRITHVGPAGEVPAGAREWNMAGQTIYPGFIEIHHELDNAANDDESNDDSLSNSLTAGSISFKGVKGDERDQGNPGAGYQLDTVNPKRRAIDDFRGKHSSFEALRELGFTSANILPSEGIFRGKGALVALRETSPNEAVILTETFQHLTMERAKGDRSYPRSLMGIVSVMRQTLLDAQHLASFNEWKQENQDSQDTLEYTPDLDALLPVVAGKQTLVIEPLDMLMVDRAGLVGKEFGVAPIIVATGNEWERPDLIAGASKQFIVPVAFPSLPKLKDDEWDSVSLDQLRNWDWAPENPAIIKQAGADIALTSHGLSAKKDFRKRIASSLERGLSREDALAALTTVPAAFLNAEDQLGSLEEGKRANLTIVAGDWFDPKSKVAEVWIDGLREEINPPDSKEEDEKKDKEKPEPSPRAAKRFADYRGPVFESDRPILFQGATVWTSANEGVLEKTDVIIDKGVIVAIGKSLATDDAWSMRDMHLVPAKDLHLTPGLIDAHSHSMILGGVNEATLPSTAMVRISDVVQSETRNIFDQLAGGLTTASLLHGSANPIGGQNSVIKLRDGASPEDLKFKEAPLGIKFALGENVKQSNWGDDYTTRFPQTRMGVRTFFFNRFTAAQQYIDAWAAFENDEGPPPRKDLELETLAEIIRGERWIHCHSYRQDEILAFLRTMEEFGVTVGTLQHVLEGYKIGDEIAKHGAGASAFADWWAYKFEVYDAIPHAGTLMHERGALVSFNSDSADLARRMNLEAAKAVKYGGLSEEEALKFVTINPAKQLRIDAYVGSIEIGKHADIALWSGHPLSTATRCEQTWVDGKKYFDRDLQKQRWKEMKAERNALIAKAQKESEKSKDEKTSEKSGGAKGALQRLLQRYQGHSLDGSYSCCRHHSLRELQ